MPRAWRDEHSQGKSRGDAQILTTCILLHSGVGLLQGVRGGGALCCRGAKGQKSVVYTQYTLAPPRANTWLHSSFQALQPRYLRQGPECWVLLEVIFLCSEPL